MTALSSGRLTYEGVSFPFGEGTPFALTMFQRGTASSRPGDFARPRADGSAFGRDFKEGATHELSLLVQGAGLSRADRERHVGELAGVLESVWDAARLRGVPGLLARLYVGDRFAYGRPREVVPDDSGRWDGVAEYGLSFAAESDRWYGQEVLVEIPLVAQATGGLPVPAAVPWVIGGGTGQADRTVVLAGDVASWPVFTLHGPVKDPWIDVPGSGRMNFKVDLAWDQSLTVDTRPWNRSIRRDGADLPGALLPSGLRLSDMSMRPGAYRIVFGGYDPTSTSRLTVRVEPAYTSF